jgi:dihydroxyacetone kinase-like protein
MKMKKFINKPENIVSELLQGLALSNPDKIRLVGSNLVARATPKAKGKVGVTLGGWP